MNECPATAKPHIPPIIRPLDPAQAHDLREWQRMRTALWTDQTEADWRAWLARGGDAAVLVAARAPRPGLCGFIEVGERAFAEGCETSPVGSIEGWWVDPDSRRQGVGSELMRAAEDWCRRRGLTELASDAKIGNDGSIRAHGACGFREVHRLVLFRKGL